MFADRAAAGRALAGALVGVVKAPCVVAAIPRGGVTVALPVAERLGAPLTVAYARKLSAPFAPELAFGAVDEDGEMVLSAGTVEALGLGEPDVAQAKVRVLAEVRRRMARYQVPPLAAFLPGSAVVLVDDGLATGLTMRAALAYARRHGATEVVVAVPCASVQAATRFREEADRFVSLIVDERFMAVGQYYADFSPVSDEEVIAMLAEAPRAPSAPAAPSSIRFRAPQGHALTGELLLPGGPGPHPVVVFAHGWGSGRQSPRNRAAAEALRGAGIGAFLFDFTGHGESEGMREASTLAQQADDLGAALDAVAGMNDIDPGRIGVAGASSGAAAALARASIDARIAALVLRSGNPAGAEDAAARVTAPVLLLVGEHDLPTLAANRAVAARLAGPCRLEVVPGGDHLFGEPAALARAVDLTVAWFAEHLHEPRGARAGAA